MKSDRVNTWFSLIFQLHNVLENACFKLSILNRLLQTVILVVTNVKKPMQSMIEIEQFIEMLLLVLLKLILQM